MENNLTDTIDKLNQIKERKELNNSIVNFFDNHIWSINTLEKVAPKKLYESLNQDLITVYECNKKEIERLEKEIRHLS